MSTVTPATWPSFPFNETFSTEFLRQVPKTDLHCHFDGSVRLETLVDLAKQQNVPLPTYDITQLKTRAFRSTYTSLKEYLDCFQYTIAVLRTTDALERVAYEQACD